MAVADGMCFEVFFIVSCPLSVFHFPLARRAS